jgi:enoyl-CoA hydratase/carnithine racemase
MAEYKNLEIVRDKKTLIATLLTGLKKDTLRDSLRELLAFFDDEATEQGVNAIVLVGDFDAPAGADEVGALCEAIESSPRPVIAAITGSAQGAGFELVLACDLRVAAESARFGFPGTGGGPAVRLGRMIGLARAKHLALTGQIIDALEAERLGLTSYTAGAAEVPVVARKLARSVASRASRK